MGAGFSKTTSDTGNQLFKLGLILLCLAFLMFYLISGSPFSIVPPANTTASQAVNCFFLMVVGFIFIGLCVWCWGIAILFKILSLFNMSSK